MLEIFIGYDPREDLAYRVCEHSIRRRASVPVKITPIKHKELREQGKFWRPWLLTGAGQPIDCMDGKPVSTEFSHSRFLTPHLGTKKWAMFVDCDFLFLEDVAKLFAEADPKYSLMCRKFPEKKNALSKEAFHVAKKMDNIVQTSYSKKLWSSLVLWNRDKVYPSVHDVSTRDGSWLHQFKWLSPTEIGSLSPAWNWINGDDAVPKAVHYTLGGPWFPNYKDCAYGNKWNEELEHMEKSC